MRDWLESKDISPGMAIGAAAAILAVLILAAYMALCIWVQRSDRLLPGTVAVNSRGEPVADLGGLTRQEALSVVADAMSRHLEGQGLTLIYGEDQRVELSGSMIASSAEAAVDLGFASKKSKPNWKLGLLWLGVMREPAELSLSTSILTPEGETQAKKIISSIADELYVVPVDFTYELGTETLTVTPGIDGSEVDKDALLDAVKEALSKGQKELRVETRPVSGRELTGEALHRLVRVDAKPAGVDEEGKLVPAVVGLSINAGKAQAALDAAGPEGPYAIPLEFTPPAPAADDSMFYKDQLAQLTSGLDLDAAEAVSACNGKVLQPGEIFSCLDTVGESGSAGQMASALYYCAVYSNLSVVERTNGAFVPNYAQAGLDAAVVPPDQDLKFRNSTGFPIRIAASTANGQFTVQFFGSNPDGIRVEAQQETKSTTGWTTVYQPDSSIPRGTTTETTVPADGCVVEVYRYVYDAGGKLLSRTLENTSTYEAQDQVILYNPADSGPWGQGVTTTPPTRPNQNPRPTPRPITPTPAPRPTERPPEASMPAWLQPSVPESSAPVNTPAPAPAETSPQATMPAWLN